MAEPILEAMMLIVERFGREFGTPLPKRLLEIGDKDSGWHVALNLTKEKIGYVDPFHALVMWCGVPAGILDPSGGVIAAGAKANEDSFCEWLEADSKNAKPEVGDG